MRRLLPLLIVLLVAVQPAAIKMALAHANLIRSEPAASAVLDSSPQTISLWFTEPLEPNFSGIRLLGGSGSVVSTPASSVDADDPKHLLLVPGTLPDGLYTVSWRAVSAADGHSTGGSYAFAIGAATGVAALASPDTETVPPFSVPVRLFDLLALALAVGSVAFAVCVSCAPPQERAMRRLMWAGWALAGLAIPLLLVYQTSLVTDEPLPDALASLPMVLFGTRFGGLLIARLIAWGVLGIAIRRRNYGIALAAGGTLVLLRALFSHSTATYDLIPSTANDWLHVMATALWVGGLAQFVNLLLSTRAEPKTLLPLVARFSNYARVCVAVLIVTGLYAAWLEVGSISALVGTLYGRSLILKAVLFAPLLLVAAVNLFLTPRGLKSGNPAWAKRLRGLVGVEIALTVGIFALAALMASVDPGRASLARRLPLPDHTIADYQIVDDIHIHLDIEPGWVGQNDFTVLLLGLDGSPVDDASLIRVRFDNRTDPVGQSELRPQPVGNGEYKISGANLSTPGTWRARVSVQRPGKFDSIADFSLDMLNAPVPPGLDMGVPLDGRRWALLVAGLALLAVGGFAGGRGRFTPFREVGILVTATLVVGMILLVGAVV